MSGDLVVKVRPACIAQDRLDVERAIELPGGCGETEERTKKSRRLQPAGTTLIFENFDERNSSRGLGP